MGVIREASVFIGLVGAGLTVMWAVFIFAVLT